MQVSRFKVLKIINDTNGKIFAVQFTKKDGTLRMMLARLGVQKDLKGGNNGASEKNSLITVWDMVANGYRMVNLETLLTLKVGGVRYEVV
ncbi:SH3 beta-barrel fold-containing protein [Sulfurovum sp. NBC37-1]|uniref:SH3 beta-barrel fold-containing protein n=1 Tax=Sulfurovum sp. (strain NBC37-1) TaxID=387093 RepID=UPI0001587B0C|nr:SH3 beta-barrel fold-containing protein [Sulfurovum sp. NBC37-1]BAF73356.1 hypothetical protein SUN_2420 [Sulfurovum sp. NBC37-1]